jgi:general secretion pathway protein J
MLRAKTGKLPGFPVYGPRFDQCGFTLIELLVAMAVLAVLASISFRGLNSILDADAHVQSETRRWNDAAVVIANMGRDISFAVARTVRDSAGGMRPGLAIDVGQDENHGQLLITRLGDGDAASAQSDLRMVGYRLRDKTLDYVIWPAVDLAPGAIPAESAILEDVSALQLRALGQDGSWTAAWPAGGLPNALPRAIEVQIVLGTGDRITRIFPLR